MSTEHIVFTEETSQFGCRSFNSQEAAEKFIAKKLAEYCGQSFIRQVNFRFNNEGRGELVIQFGESAE